MQQEAKIITCGGCGASLDVEINRPFIFCKYCGCKNIIEQEQMKATINVGGAASISANTDMESLLNAVNYLIASEKFDQAEEYLTSLLVSGCNDYRLHLYQITIAFTRGKFDQAEKHLNTLLASGCDDYRPYIQLAMNSLRQTKLLDTSPKTDQMLFQCLDKLRTLEASQQSQEITSAICRLMEYQTPEGLTILIKAVYYLSYDRVVYCVEHGADVNAVYIGSEGKANPMWVSYITDKDLDGVATTKKQRNALELQIRKYLSDHGGKDFSLLEMWGLK